MNGIEIKSDHRGIESTYNDGKASMQFKELDIELNAVIIDKSQDKKIGGIDKVQISEIRNAKS